MDDHRSTLTQNEVAALVPALQPIARRMCRGMPTHLLDSDDFLQIGLLGCLSVRAHTQEAAEQRFQRLLTAGKREMIDAWRRFRPASSRLVRRKGKLTVMRALRQIEVLASERIVGFGADQGVEIDYDLRLDLQRALATCTPREYAALRAWSAGFPLWEIGRSLGVGEAMACLLKQQAVRKMREYGVS